MKLRHALMLSLFISGSVIAGTSTNTVRMNRTGFVGDFFI